MSRHVNIRYFLSKIVEIRGKSRKNGCKWAESRLHTFSHSDCEWNRTSQHHWTQCPNNSWCQRSYFSPFSEQNVPILESFWVEQNVPIPLNTMAQYFLMSGVWFLSVFRTERHSEWNTMSQYFFLSWVLFLSLTFGHITLKSVWSSLNLVWHMSCRTSIVPVNIHQFEPCRDIRSYISDVYMGSNWTYSISWWDINYMYILFILYVPLSFEWLAIKWNLIVLLADARAQQTSLTSIALLVHSILQIMFSHKSSWKNVPSIST